MYYVLSVSNVRYGSVIFYMNVEPILLEVLSHHLSGLDNAVLLGQILLCEELCMFICQF